MKVQNFSFFKTEIYIFQLQALGNPVKNGAQVV